ncbi:MAG: T9SS type A sorting domain-containing protein [Chitinophagaceae bacterium]|nr:T9SS type A sorting domain-containing protein [Chitinophagaceae bacterium]
MSGPGVLRQQNNVEQGTNSVPLNNFTTLQPGTYILQMNDGVNIQTTKFIIAK